MTLFRGQAQEDGGGAELGEEEREVVEGFGCKGGLGGMC